MLVLVTCELHPAKVKFSIAFANVSIFINLKSNNSLTLYTSSNMSLKALSQISSKYRAYVRNFEGNCSPLVKECVCVCFHLPAITFININQRRVWRKLLAL